MDISLARLVFDMSANVANLQKDMAQANTAVQGAVGQMNAAIGTLKTALGGLGIAASATGIYELGKAAVEGAANMERMSMRTGVAVEALSAMRMAAKLSGTDMEAVAGVLQKLNKNMVEARDPASKSAEGFRALGVSVTDSTGKMRKQADVVLDIAKAFAGSTQDSTAYAAVTKAMGKTAQEVVPFLLELSEKGSLVGKITGEQARQAHEFERAMAQLKATTEGYVRGGVLELLPILTKLPGLFKVVAEAAAAYWVIFYALPAVFTAAMVAFDAYALRVYAGETLIGALVPATNAAILTIGPTWAALAGKFGIFQTAVMSGLGLLAAAFIGWQVGSWLRDNFLEAQLAGIAFVDGTLKAWEALKYGVAVAWAYIKDRAREAFADIGGYFADVLGAISSGLQALGKTEAAATLQGWSDSLKTATDNTGKLDAELAGLRTGYEKATADITTITDDMAAEAIAHFAAGKAAKEHGGNVIKMGKDGSAAYKAMMEEIQKHIDVLRVEIATGREISPWVKQYTEEMTKAKAALEQHKITSGEYQAILRKINEELRLAIDKEQMLAKLRNARFEEEGRQQIQEESATDQAARAAHASQLLKTQLDQNDALKNEGDLLKRERELLGATDAQRQLELDKLRSKQQLDLDIKRINEDLMLDERDGAIARAQAAAAQRDQNAQLKADLADQKEALAALEGLGTKLWDDFWHGGHDRLRKLGQDIKTYLYDELTKVVMRQWIIPILAQVTGGGAAGAAGSAAGSAGTSMLGSAVGSMFGAGGMGGALSAGAGWLTGANTLAGTMEAAGSLIGTGTMAGAASGVMMGIGAAMPIIGAVLLVASALGAFKHGGPKSESGFGAGMPTRGDASGATNIAQAIQQSYAQAAGALGLDTKLQNLGVFYAQDPQGTAQTQLQVTGGSYSRSAMYGGQYENVGRSDEAFTQAVALASAQLVVKNLQEAAKGPVGDFLRGIDLTSASLETLQAALATATNVGQFYDTVTAMGPQFASLANLSVLAADGLLKLTGGLQGLVQLTDNYMSLFGSPGEQAQYTAGKIASTLNKAGANTTVEALLGMTRDEFTRWVDTARASSSGLYVALLSVASAFNELHPALQQAATDASTTANTLDTASKATDAAMAALKRSVDAQKAQVQAQMETTTGSIGKLQGVFSFLQQQVQQLYTSVPQSGAALAAQGRALIDDAIKTGNIPDQQALGDAVGAITQQVTSAKYATEKDAELARLLLAGKLDTLKTVAGQQLTDAQAQLAAEKQQLQELDAVVANAEHQLNVLRGIDDSVVTVREAVDALRVAMTTEAAAKAGVGVVAGAPGSFTPGFDAAGNFVDASGSTFVSAAAMAQVHTVSTGLADFAMSYFQQYGQTPGARLYPDDATAAVFAQNKDALTAYVAGNAPKFAVGTNYVPHDMLAMVHRGEAIVPAPFNPAAGGFSSSTAFVSYFQRMADRLDRMHGTLQQHTKHLGQMDEWVNGKKPAARVKTVTGPGVVG